MISRERLVETFLELARTDSPTFKERKIANIVMKHLDKLGYEYFEDDAKSKIDGDTGNIICRVEGDKSLPPIVVSAHMDTVTPCIDKNPIIKGDMIVTNGKTILGGDDHAGVTAILELLYLLKEEKPAHGDITAIFTVAEEKGLLGSKNLDFSKINAKYGFILDDGGPIGTVTYQAPSQNSIKAVIRGKAAHAGVEPEKGINAIVVCSHAISKMNIGRIDEQTTCNIGVISGGSATNIVCDKVEVLGEVRSISQESLEKQTEHIRTCFMETAQQFGAEVEFSSKHMYSTFHIEETHPIVGILKEASQKAGVKLELVKSGGGSDTNILNANGIPAVNLSVGMEKVHTVDEFIRIDDMVKSTEFLYQIVQSVR